jgi:hypothetical protein
LRQINVHALNGRKIPVKGFITYNKENGAFTISKHVACDHVEEVVKRWGAYVLKQQKKDF